MLKSLSGGVAVACLAFLTACGQITPAEVQTAQGDQAKVAALCNTAMGLAPIAGPYAVWITAGCGTEELVANLALQPGAADYLNGIIAKVQPK